jgi:hypothetical protein
MHRIVLVSAQEGLLIMQDVVLLMTAAFILWYTIETKRLRKAIQDSLGEATRLRNEASQQTREIIRQNKIAVRPVIVPEFFKNGESGFWLANYGAGCALNVGVLPMVVKDAAVRDRTIGDVSLCFTPYQDALSTESSTRVHIAAKCNGMPETDSDVRFVFHPNRLGPRVELATVFQDVEGQAYRLVTVIGSGVDLQAPYCRDVILGPIEEIPESSP